ncbi:hypothetical protein ACC755_21200 [Rhizobium ruizarguesonis]|jgi:hypothetical protein|uniref:hypothetical protein n=1 Tax=Rhizobium TaxID=379 RepID=UPI0010303E19|nr:MULTISPECIES: hypothetical protein [Rhizobium]MBY2941403.1 hypothetical protein [Rhizobium leguminosarum]MBY2961673.1 hypothetical protein [Rhizobium leguminosarum]TAY93593.1 hypothetical protein ELH85_10640 [Rhizobium ruizarguesonis]
MDKLHEPKFLARLERVFTIGVVEIHKAEMKRWFGQERIARRVWREISAYWADIADEPHRQKLLVGGLEGDNWIFIWGEGNGTTAQSYLQDVRYLAGEATAEGQPIAIPED